MAVVSPGYFRYRMEVGYCDHRRFATRAWCRVRAGRTLDGDRRGSELAALPASGGRAHAPVRPATHRAVEYVRPGVGCDRGRAEGVPGARAPVRTPPVRQPVPWARC